MKGKYISTSLMLAVLAGGNNEHHLLVQETHASTSGHKIIWHKSARAIQKFESPQIKSSLLKLS